MKKLTALLCSAMLAVGAASAQEQTIDFSYCGNHAFVGGIGNPAQGPAGGAIQLTDDVVNTYKGFKITHVLVCNGSTSRVLTGGVKVHINIFVSDDEKLPRNPVTLTGEDNLMNLSKAFEWSEYKLAEPVELKAGTPLWVGFVCPDSDAGDSPVAVDMSAYNGEPCNYIGQGNNGNYIWDRLNIMWGGVGIKVRLVGEGLPDGIVTVGSGAMEVSTVTPDTPFNVGFTFTNGGVNTIESLGVACSINGGEEQMVEVTPEKPVAASSTGTAYFKFTCPDELYNARLECRIAEVNGQPNNATEKTTFGSTFTCVKNGYPRAMVVEEGTGTWCGWCVRGIVGLEGMAEEHHDGSFIGIAVHAGDPMVPNDAYAPLYTALNTSYPGCLVNREKSIGRSNPQLDVLQNLYPRITTAPAIVELKAVEAKVNTDKTVEITTDATFALDIPEADFGIAYVIIEDKVGPYAQTNSYSGGAAGAMGGWESKGASVLTLYNDVARYISSYQGDENSVPAAIEGGKAIRYTATLPISSVKKIENMRFAALVIDRVSGTILNGLGFKDADISGIETVETETVDAPAVYFDLMGRRVANPAPGQLLISNGAKIIK